MIKETPQRVGYPSRVGVSLMALMIPVVVWGLWILFFPPHDEIIRTAGRAGASYGPDVIGLDASGRVQVNGNAFAQPVGSRFDQGATRNTSAEVPAWAAIRRSWK